MQICGLNKTTLLDFPEHVAATVFTGGCNFRCPFCQNGDLVLHPEQVEQTPEEEFFSFLKKRKGILTGVCITGGEPTLQADLENFIRKIKELGFLVKLDTNGSRPDVLKKLVQEELLDYVAMDIKSSPENYGAVCGNAKVKIEDIRESVSFLLNGTLPYEFRTTVVRELHTKKDFEKIGNWIAGCQAYFLQSYVESDGVLCKAFTAYEKEELMEFVDNLKKTIPNTALRGVD
ncbi:MAG: anaerobic ribonucleoside-triphosphate reductase activating protein [Lachnospiraceae bacterium]|nr:anaerobic ribonucleoside-triphosphate reductase activating protein [Lachnospiraceae bacterium]